MARTTEQILAQIERLVPESYRPLRPVLAGVAAQLRQLELTGEASVDDVTIGGAEGTWLTLLARGYGVRRSTGESDASVRGRLRNVDERLTVTAIETAVDAILPSGSCTVVEHYKSGIYLTSGATVNGPEGYSFFLDCPEPIPGETAFASYFYDQHNAFSLVVPLYGDLPFGDSYLGSSFLDTMFLGGGESLDSTYFAVVSLVEDLRAAGVRWWLVIDS